MDDAAFFDGVAREVATVVGVRMVTIDRYDADGASTVLASVDDPAFPVGSRWPLDGPSLGATVLGTGRPARVDDYRDLESTSAAAARAWSITSTVGVPIIVDGSVWGVICVGSSSAQPLPDDTEERLTGFTELAATAIANSAARTTLRMLVSQQVALRRVATLVAEGAAPTALFSTVADEIGRLFDVAGVTLNRYDGDSCVVLADPQNSGFPVGSRWPLHGDSLARRVLTTGRPARIDDYDGLPGEIAAHMRELGMASAVGVPIVVGGELWGVLTVGAPSSETLPADTAERLAGFTDLVGTALANTEARDELRMLADEQAALRRVATLVAKGTAPNDLFAAVAQEIGQLFDVATVTLDRYDGDESVVLADWGGSGFHAGTRWPLDGHSLAAAVLATGQPARIDDYALVDGTIAKAMRNGPSNSAVGVPIVVEGRVWGVLCVGMPPPGPMPQGTEARVARFTELVATALSNSEARDSLRTLVDEQAALRRVATLVAEGATAAELFSAVAAEVGSVLGVPGVSLDRYDADGATTVVAVWGEAPYAVGTRWPLEPGTVARTVLDTALPARVNDYSVVQGAVADVLQEQYPNASIVGVPIAVDGKVWGMMGVGTPWPAILPADTEVRLTGFTELVGTAIANSAARDSLRMLAEEQTALRRVATLVAEGAPAPVIMTAVANEVRGLLDVPAVTLDRYEADGTSTVLGTSGDFAFPTGSSWPVDPGTVAWMVQQTGRPARLDASGYAELDGAVATALRDYPAVSIVGVPIEVEGEVWGIMGVASAEAEPLPPGMEERLEDFTELVATAISNAEARDRVRALAEEHASLHRVAALVAKGTDSHAVFDAVCAETGPLVGATTVNLSHYTSDGYNETMAGWSLRDTHVPVGTRLPVTSDTIAGEIVRTNAPARMDSWEHASSELGTLIRERGIRSSVGAPVVVEGQLWGALVAATDSDETLPPGTEHRLASFTELIATAISNAATRSQLIASRARIVAAGDEARKRIERNLHDGTQQQLIALSLELQAVRATVPEGHGETHQGFERMEREIENVLEDVRELSRGLHPALLARGGLRASLRALARRLPIPVEFSIELAERPPEAIETGVYYVVSEALTNAVKHSRATSISVTVARDGPVLRASIADDGVGGADPGVGSGLTGLIDRVEALGGRLTLRSPSGAGTTVAIELPMLD